MKNSKLLRTFFLSCFILIVKPGFSQNENSNDSGNDQQAILKIQEEINKYPDSLTLHEKYLKASGFTRWGAKDNTAFVNQYKKWMAKYPKSAVLPYALGHAFAQKESPKAKPYLLQAVKLNPRMDEAYFDLWIDAERWGQFEKGQEYIGKASEIKPDDPDYAFYYANTFEKNNQEKYLKLSLEVANRFPQSERGAQALYWLAANSKDVSSKIKYYELLKDKFPPSKFGWSSSGMSGYFNLLLIPSPEQAESLASEMVKISKEKRDIATWKTQESNAKNILKIKSLLNAGKASEAIPILDSIKIPFYFSNAIGDFLLLKADVYKESNQMRKAYNILLMAYAKNPSDEIGKALYNYGNSINENKSQVDQQVWNIRVTGARKATDFSLNKYFSKGKASLKDYRGKVILLTYWFPGCGPCRGEFPHFQNVVNKFKDKDLVYIGINIVPEQNDYVIPFLKSSGYTFIPLEDYEGRDKGNLNNGGAAPVNFLIDKEGRIVFKNIRTNGDNEDVLTNMISALLKQS